MIVSLSRSLSFSPPPPMLPFPIFHLHPRLSWLPHSLRLPRPPSPVAVTEPGRGTSPMRPPPSAPHAASAAVAACVSTVTPSNRLGRRLQRRRARSQPFSWLWQKKINYESTFALLVLSRKQQVTVASRGAQRDTRGPMSELPSGKITSGMLTLLQISSEMVAGS